VLEYFENDDEGHFMMDHLHLHLCFMLTWIDLPERIECKPAATACNDMASLCDYSASPYRKKQTP
jgi:hypothetical protein